MLIQRFVELLTPLQCLECARDGAVLCDGCVGNYSSAKPQVCFQCGLLSPAGRTCERCRIDTALAGVSVGAHYDGAVKELVLQLKFHRLRSAAAVAAELVLVALPEDLAVDMVTAVPVSAARYRERGYNQAELVARAVAQRLRLPYAPLLGRETSVHQLGHDRLTRLGQIKGAFYPRRGLRAERVLVVDDVVTTGATLAECAETLVAAGAESVWAGAVARH
jgi:ComF family protein